jgi:putative transposase
MPLPGPPARVLHLASRQWRMPSREWAMAEAELAILFEDRFRLA